MTLRLLILLLTLAPLAACETSATQTSNTTQNAAQAAPVGREVNSDAKLLADFKAKVEKYADVRDQLDNHTAPLKKTDDPAAITAAERALAEKIRQTRPGAKRGEFFTPATGEVFKRLLKPALKGPEGPENRNAIKDDNPEKVPFQINGEYPKEETVSTVPPDVLLNLPALPENVQYRFVGKHLILYDARANIIIDYLLNVIP